MRDIKVCPDGWIFIKDGIMMAFYDKTAKQYIFYRTVISDEDLEWFRDILH